MRIGYGYKRQYRDFERANVEQVWIDHPGTHRAEREDMLVRAMRPGDTIVLLAPGDLGFGGELPLLRRAIRERGVTLEVVPDDSKKPGPRGRPSLFDPTPEQFKRLKRLYTDTFYNGRHIYEEGVRMAGWESNKRNRERIRQWLINKFGARGVLKREDE